MPSLTAFMTDYISLTKLLTVAGPIYVRVVIKDSRLRTGCVTLSFLVFVVAELVGSGV